jgi:hypothetical protein
MARRTILFCFLLAPVILAEEISPDRSDVRVSNGKFVVRGVPTFLLGISYYDGMTAPKEVLKRDFAYLDARGFNAVRVWATWYRSISPQATPLIRRNGTLNPAGWSRLQGLLELARTRGFVVDLTFSRDVLQPISFAAYRNGIRNAAIALRPYAFVMIDVQNETNTCGQPEDPGCTGHITLEQAASIRAAIRQVSGRQLVTASRNAYSLVPGLDDYRAFRDVARVDFIATHRPPRAQDGAWAQVTDDEVRLIRRAIGPGIPILFDEPNRCGRNVRCDDPSVANLFLAAVRNAGKAGAAGWFFHTDAGFRLNRRTLAEQLNAVERSVVDRIGRFVPTN